MPKPVKINLSVEAVIAANVLVKVMGWIPSGLDYSVSTEWADQLDHLILRLEVKDITTDQAQDIMHEIGKDSDV